VNGSDRESVVEYGFRRFVVVFAIILATLLEIVDTTIVNVALPNIQGGLGANLEQAAWISTGYIIANVIVIPITPWLALRFGRRNYFFTSIAIFTFASAMCGLSNSIEMLVFWRIIQGIGGGGLISTSQAILRETFPSTQQGAAAGIFAMGVIVGPTVGPTIGGLITDNFGWPMAFYVNVPLGILAMTLVARFLRDPVKAQKLPLDFIGLGLLAVGVGSMQYVLDQGQQKDWFGDSSIVIGTVLAIGGLVAFVLYEFFGTKKPIVDLRILRYRSVWSGSLLGMCLGISLYGSVLLLPQFVENSLGFTATLSGELLIMRAAFVMLFTPFVARLAGSGKVDARIFVASGFIMVGLSNILLARVTTSDSSFWTFLIPLALSGVGLSQLFVPLTISTIGSVKPAEIPAASAFFNLARQIGGSVAIAVLVTVLARQGDAHRTALASSITPNRAPIAHTIQRQGSIAAAARQLDQLVGAQSQVLAYADTALDTALITLVLTPLVFLMRRSQQRSAPALAE